MGVFNLLGDGDFSVASSEYKFLAEIANFLNEAVGPITIVLLVAAAVFSVVIAFMIMKAESSDKANEMKKRLWHLIITVICVDACLWLLKVVFANIDSIIGAFRG